MGGGRFKFPTVLPPQTAIRLPLEGLFMDVLRIRLDDEGSASNAASALHRRDAVQAHTHTPTHMR